MTTNRNWPGMAFAALIAAGSALAPAAHADDPVLDGAYTFFYDWSQHTLDGVSAPVPELSSHDPDSFTPCGPGCTNSATGAQLHLVNGRWEFSKDARGAARCPDGTARPGTITWSFDAVTLTGARTGHADPGCGGAPSVDVVPITVTKN